MQLQYKSLQECDPDQLVELESRSFASDRISRRSFVRLLRSATAEGLGVFQGSRLVGYSLLLFRRNSRQARIYSLAVADDMRGRGIGRRLLENAEQLAHARGCNRVQLEVSSSNQAGLDLYHSQGYALSGRRPGYYEDGGDALVLVKQLARLDTSSR